MKKMKKIPKSIEDADAILAGMPSLQNTLLKN